MIKALIFDVDGTLAETEELHRAAFNAAFTHFGLNWHWSQEDYHQLLKTTGGKERLRHFATSQSIPMSDAEIAELHQWKTNHYIALLESGELTLRSGIETLIEKGRAAGLKLALATTTNLPNVEALSQACFHAPAEDIFDAIAAGDMVKNKKPAPDVYRLALKQLAIPAENCIAFEDTLNGVKSAQAAGIKVVLSQGTYSKDEPSAPADYVIPEFTEAPAILNL